MSRLLIKFFWWGRSGAAAIRRSCRARRWPDWVRAAAHRSPPSLEPSLRVTTICLVSSVLCWTIGCRTLPRSCCIGPAKRLEAAEHTTALIVGEHLPAAGRGARRSAAREINGIMMTGGAIGTFLGTWAKALVVNCTLERPAVAMVKGQGRARCTSLTGRASKSSHELRRRRERVFGENHVYFRRHHVANFHGCAPISIGFG